MFPGCVHWNLKLGAGPCQDEPRNSRSERGPGQGGAHRECQVGFTFTCLLLYHIHNVGMLWMVYLSLSLSKNVLACRSTVVFTEHSILFMLDHIEN